VRTANSITQLLRGICRLTGILAAVLVLLAIWVEANVYSGRVMDAVTKSPIAGALVTLENNVLRTDPNGMFRIEGTGDRIGVRAPGYLREDVETVHWSNRAQEVTLKPFKPKALYLSFFGIGSAVLRGSALSLIESTELNALVIDVKSDRGMIPFKSSIPLAAEVGAQSVATITGIQALIRSLREKGIYTIARIVVFKDNPPALSRPDLAVRSRSGAIWRDRENLAWSDPFRKEF